MVYPYTGMQVSLDGTGRSEKVVLFCGHHLVETVGVHHLKAYEFCRSEQNISELSTASSPPSNFRLYRVYDNFDDHSATVVIRWKAPHDVVRGKRVTRYFFKIVGHGKADVSERVTQESDTPDTYYNVTVTGLQYNQTHRFTVTPIVDREPSECGILGCQEYGDRAHLSFFIQDVDACSVIAGTNKTTYCDEHADC
uniref:Fibronectin type-III domain-containing protein n=2 Tax=Ciona intestinalis TaxID=7719 RepID=F6Y0E2_CIOIN